MLPPQAPPAHIQHVYQEAQQAYDRIVGVQAWLANERAALPATPESIDAVPLNSFIEAHRAYWYGPATDGGTARTRRDAFAARIADGARALAVLAYEDGTLDADARDLARSVTIAGGAAESVVVRELRIGGTGYAGVLLVQDLARDNRVLAFSTQTGWEPFDDLEAAYAAFEARFRAMLVTSSDLPGLARRYAAGIAEGRFIDSRPMSSDPFTAVVNRFVGVQREKLNQAWFEAKLAGDADRSSRLLVDGVTHALRDDYLFDATSLLAIRQAAVVDAVNEARLARVPANVAADWRDASEHFLATHDLLAADAGKPHAAPVKGLYAFTHDGLRTRLKALGVTLDPSDIRIDIENYHSLLPQSVLDFLAGGKPPSLSLVDLAYRNIGGTDPVRMKAIGPDGAPVAGLDDAALRVIVNDLDVHRTYPAYLDTALRSGPDATARRDATSSLQLAQMRLLANEARLSYFLSDLPRSFQKDHAYRGYRWVEAVLASPSEAGRARVENHDIQVSQLTYQGVALRDVFMVGVRDPRSVSTIVLYTPEAPDGISFREFGSRAEAARQFLYAPRFREYLLDRLPLEHAAVRPNGTRVFAGDRLANWILGSSASAADVTFTAEPFDERRVTGDFLHALYETDVQLGQRNARTLTTSTDDAKRRWTEEYDRRVLESLGRVVRDVVTAPVHAASAGWRLYDSVKAGDTRQAFVDFTELYVASLWAAPGAQQFVKVAAGRGFVGGRFRAGGTLVEGRAPAPQKVVFESQYRAPNVRKTGQASSEGVYTIDGKQYIEHDGGLYGVRFDADYGTWRLARPGAASGAWGPAIERGASQGWAFRTVGLRGGSGRGAGVRPTDLFDDYADEIERAFPDPVERERVATAMRAELTENIPAMITPAQRAAWETAALRGAGRAIQRDPWVGGLPRSVAMDLSQQPLPPGIRRVPAHEVPPQLWFYDELPFKRSRLTRSILVGNQGYSNNTGTIRTTLLRDGFPVVRATSFDLSAPHDQIIAAMGLRGLPRSKTFAVEFNARSLAERPPHLARPAVEVFAPVDGPAGTYYLMPADGATELRIFNFHVYNTLAPR